MSCALNSFRSLAPWFWKRSTRTHQVVPQAPASHAKSTLSGQAPRSHYRGVSLLTSGKWQASAMINRERRYLGCFESRTEAAMAYDKALRTAGLAAQEMRRLNFPTAGELELVASVRPELLRMENLTRNGRNNAKEAAAKTFIKAHVDPTCFEMRWLGEGTLADGIARPMQKYPNDEWLGIQVKSTESVINGAYCFNKTLGYSGLMVVLVALQEEMLWVIPGSTADVNHISVTPGGKWDAFRCTWKGLPFVLHSAWAHKDKGAYVRRSAEAWETPITDTHKVEHLSLTSCRQLFTTAGLPVARPLVEHTPVDMIVNRGIRVQIKARSKPRGKCHSYKVELCRHAGRGARQPYEVDAFDALIVCILRDGGLVGLFIFPVSELLQQGLVGDKARQTSLSVYPPWSTPTHKISQKAKISQAPFYFDVQGGAPKDSLPTLRRLFVACQQEKGLGIASIDSSRFHSLITTSDGELG